jgi:hypothetical protein
MRFTAVGPGRTTLEGANYTPFRPARNKIPPARRPHTPARPRHIRRGPGAPAHGLFPSDTAPAHVNMTRVHARTAPAHTNTCAAHADAASGAATRDRVSRIRRWDATPQALT